MMGWHHGRGSKESVRRFAGCFLLILLAKTTAYAKADLGKEKAYYGRSFYEKIQARSSYPEIKKDLYVVLSSIHEVVEGDFDKIHDKKCEKDACYKHRKLTYREAREYLFGQLHLKGNKPDYFITEVYCEETLDKSSFPKGRGPAPGRIPNPHIVNAEHTWPQSLFNRKEGIELQRSDLHALYPAKPEVNSSRKASEFAQVDEVKTSQCPGAYLGYAEGGGNTVYFEPPDSHKGNVARSLFYFATRYNLEISDFQEKFLRDWHKLDPADQEEKDRHEMIFELQKTRNPFVDHPELVNLINDF